VAVVVRVVRVVDLVVHVVVGLDKEDILVDAAGAGFFASVSPAFRVVRPRREWGRLRRRFVPGRNRGADRSGLKGVKTLIPGSTGW
jgi:hypothetical protein